MIEDNGRSLVKIIRQHCGDKEVENGVVAVGLFIIDYPCKLTLSAEEIAESVQALNNDIEILKALNLRHSQLSGRVFDIESIVRTSGLNNLFQK